MLRASWRSLWWHFVGQLVVSSIATLVSKGSHAKKRPVDRGRRRCLKSATGEKERDDPVSLLPDTQMTVIGSSLWVLSAYSFEMPRVLAVTMVPSGNSSNAIGSPTRAFSRAISSSCLANGSLSVAHLRAIKMKPKSWHAEPTMGIRRSEFLSEMKSEAEWSPLRER